VRKFLDENAPMEEVRRVAESKHESFDRELWDRMAELGWLGLALPEEHGGAVLVTAETVRAAEAAHQLTTEYAKQRVQFRRSGHARFANGVGWDLRGRRTSVAVVAVSWSRSSSRRK
jgi:alkylation response protein AidB-like acyl-CoA dehydrogenase